MCLLIFNLWHKKEKKKQQKTKKNKIRGYKTIRTFTKRIEDKTNDNNNKNNNKSNNNNISNITTKPRTVVTTVNRNQIYSIYPMFIFLKKLSEATASVFKFTLLCRYFDMSPYVE